MFTFTGGEFTATGLVTGDTVDSVTLASAGADAAAVAGIYPIVASNAVGAGLGNYAVTYADGAMTVSGGAVVTPTYKFSVFSKPLRAKDRKKFHVGDKVLVKFTIKDDTGAKVTTLQPQVKIQPRASRSAPRRPSTTPRRRPTRTPSRSGRRGSCAATSSRPPWPGPRPRRRSSSGS